MSLLRFAVSFLQKRGFPLKAGGSPAILAAKTWQYILKYGWCWGSFCFCCYFSAIVSFGDHWRFFGRVFSIVVLVHFCRCNLPLWCSQFSPLQLTRPHPIVASLFVLISSLHFRRPSLCITFSPTLFLHHKRSRSPKHRRGESEWIPRSTPNGFAYVFNFALNMPW